MVKYNMASILEVLVSEEGTILWQLTGDLKAEIDSEIITSKVRQTANADCVNSVMN